MQETNQVDHPFFILARPAEVGDEEMHMSNVETAIRAVQCGEIVVVADDENRENEGDLIMAADAATPKKLTFFLEHTSGLICASVTPTVCDRLNLPPMVEQNTDPNGTAFTVSVDASRGVTTGISAADRAATLNTLADPRTTVSDLRRPGHILPLRSRQHGVLARDGHTEAANDLVSLAGRGNVGVLCEVVTPDRSAMATGADLQRLARQHAMPFIAIADIQKYRLSRERLLSHVSEASIPTAYGDFQCHVWRSLIDATEQVALVKGDISPITPTLVRVHSECLTGDVFGSRRCDCGTQLEDSMRLIAQTGSGVVLYLRGHEGRGIGLAKKLQAYELQDQGHDTVDANLLLGVPVDGREYGLGAQILHEFGVTQMRLITNNPAKSQALADYGIETVERVALPVRQTPENLRYLTTKRQRMGHLLPRTSMTLSEAQ